MNVECNECKKDFDIKIETRRTGTDGIEQGYFTCTHCKHEFISFYTDPSIRALQKDVTDLRGRLQRSKKPEQQVELNSRLDVKIKDLKEQIEALRKKVDEGQVTAE